MGKMNRDTYLKELRILYEIAKKGQNLSMALCILEKIREIEK